MPFRGFFALNGVELTNSSRVVAHLGMDTPVSDVGVLSQPDRSLIEDPPGSGLYIPASPEIGDGLYSPDFSYLVGEESPDGSGLYKTGECQLTEYSDGLYVVPPTAVESVEHDQLYSPPNGSILYGQGLIQVEDGCWGSPNTCRNCAAHVGYDDSWPGLADFLNDPVYRVELAPWYSTRSPESAEFLGVWVVDVKGLDTTPSDRPIIELVGAGAAAGPSRDTSRNITFEAILIACSNAGLEYGLQWLACRLRETNDDTESSLQYFKAHPSATGADPVALQRELRGVVLKGGGPSVVEAVATGRGPNRQANIYRVTWDMVATNPYAYAPPIPLGELDWMAMESQPIQWVHAAQCVAYDCADMPVLFSATCAPETIDVVTSPPPSCGGCMPVCAMETYVYHLPTLDYPLRCQETAVNVMIQNTDSSYLTLQAYFRECTVDIKCDDGQLFPLQISGLHPQGTITLDAVTGRYWASFPDNAQAPLKNAVKPGMRGRKLKAMGIVGTPTGAPWEPPIIDREGCWELVVYAPEGSDFEVSLSMSDREA